MPSLLTTMKNTSELVSGEVYLLSALAALQKVVETLPHFISPYLEGVLSQVSHSTSTCYARFLSHHPSCLVMTLKWSSLSSYKAHLFFDFVECVLLPFSPLHEIVRVGLELPFITCRNLCVLFASNVKGFLILRCLSKSESLYCCSVVTWHMGSGQGAFLTDSAQERSSLCSVVLVICHYEVRSFNCHDENNLADSHTLVARA